MTFDLQMFATTWKFDSGVGMENDYQTINIKTSGGRGFSASAEAVAGTLDTGTNFSITNGSTWTQIYDDTVAKEGWKFDTSSGVSTGVSINGRTVNLDLAIDTQRRVQGINVSGTSWGATNVSYAAIQLGGQYLYDGSTVNTRAGAIGTSDWSDSFRTETVTLLNDLKFGETPMTLNIDNMYTERVALAGYNANLKLTATSKNVVTVNGIDTNNGVGRVISFGTANEISLRSGDGTLNGTGVKVTNDKYTAVLGQKSDLTAAQVVGKGNGKLEFQVGDTGTGTVLNFAQGSDSVYVDKKWNASDTQITLDQVGYTELKLNATDTGVSINSMRGDNKVLIKGSDKQTYVRIKNDDSQGGKLSAGNQVSIVAGDSGCAVNANGVGNFAAVGINAVLSGVGVESVFIGDHGGVVKARNWAKNNVVSIGDHGILAIEGDLDSGIAGVDGFAVGTHLSGSGDRDKMSESGNPSVLQIGSVADGTAEGTNKLGKYQSLNVQAQGKTYSALVVSDSVLSASDTGLNFGYDMIVGDCLNLGDRTDKKVVYLNNGLGKNDWGETVSYSANMTSVRSSSAGGSLLIGDFENAVNFYGNGDQDSLFAGYDYNQDSLFAGYDYNLDKTGGTRAYDTLGSAQGKKAWMGTSDYSGLTVVELVHNGQKTNNFGFVDEDSETNTTADVLALMNGAAYRKLEGSEHQLANLAIGADSVNNFTFKSITEGQHKINYTYDLGKTNSTALVDTSLQGSKSGFDYESDISFYLGFDKGTVLTFDSKDSKQKLNYDGGAVLMGISSIDGSKGGADNILNGETNHAEFIIGSETGATTLSGGFANGYVDTASDTLVGGSKGDQFWVGANMGDDVVTNVGEGDTIVFLGSKFADATLKHDMLVDGDASNYTVEFKDGSTVKFSTATGTKMSDIGSLTCKFDDATYSWNGTEWAKA